MALYERERDGLMVFVARRTLDVALAADVTAETFAVALSSWSSLRGRSEEEARGWLFTVARRQLSRYYRRARVERRAIERLGISMPMIHEEDVAEIERRAGLGQLRAALRVELARLSEQQRDALRLRIVQGLPYPDVAEVLAITEQAARARVSRGLRALATAMKTHGAVKEVL